MRIRLLPMSSQTGTHSGRGLRRNFPRGKTQQKGQTGTPLRQGIATGGARSKSLWFFSQTGTPLRQGIATPEAGYISRTGCQTGTPPRQGV
ncbi:hypothetical protein ACQZV8_03505 [Magnetococcales bacterium HHB-1]